MATAASVNAMVPGDCPNRDHDAFRRINKPCRLCAVEKTGATSIKVDWLVHTVQLCKLQKDADELRDANKVFEAENARLRIFMEAQVEANRKAHRETMEIVNRIHTEIEAKDKHTLERVTALTSELDKTRAKLTAAVKEIARLQDELGKVHAPPVQ